MGLPHIRAKTKQYRFLLVSIFGFQGLENELRRQELS
jgi:hypothetical protein